MEILSSGPILSTGDLLTLEFFRSVTNPRERQPREGFENKVPRTPGDFEKYWLSSTQYKLSQEEASRAEEVNADGKETLETFREAHHQRQADHVRPKSPYVISIPMQVRLCTTRAYQRLWNDKASTM